MPRHAAPATDALPLQPVSQFAAWHGDALDWERLPSVSDSIAERLARLLRRHRREAEAAAQAAEQRWSRTQAAEFDALPLAEPFREALQGLAIREVHEPAVFRYFFGSRRG